MNTRRHIVSTLLLAALAAAGILAPSAQAQTAGQPGVTSRASETLPGRYIVVFRNHVADPAQEARALAQAAGGQVLTSYRHAIKGAAVRIPQDRAAGFEAAMSRNPNVVSVELDATVHINFTQDNATWGLDRVDQRVLPLDKSYTYDYTGAGVYAFIIDTGIRASHKEFGGRVQGGAYVIDDGRKTDDCNGHGTHVAGTVGGSTYGVAKGSTLVPVRVLDCNGSGTMAGVIAGVDWVAGTTLRPAVGNMSLGGGKSTALNAAVAGAVAKGVTMVVAAGNSNLDACNYSPASEPSALTVGATTSTDARASYSNYGSCLDLFAPGSSITSAWIRRDTATNTISGTSMASPHVAGVAVLTLHAQPGATPAQVAQSILDNATADKVGSAGGGSPNLLVYSLASATDGGGTGGDTGTPPPATTTVSVASLSGQGERFSPNSWLATATVTLSTTVGSATVYGSFSSGGGSASCTITGDQPCSLTSSALSTKKKNTTFSVTNVTSEGLAYDSNGTTSIDITRP